MDRLLTNRYFCIAILIALCVVVYLYSQSDYCSIEGMQNIELSPLGQELNSPPWTNSSRESLYAKVNTKDDDAIMARLTKEGTDSTKFLPRSDVLFMNYVKSEDIENLTDSDNSSDIETTPPVKKKSIKKKGKRSSYPQPLDTRPDLSQCQPCAPCGERDSITEKSGFHGKISGNSV